MGQKKAAWKGNSTVVMTDLPINTIIIASIQLYTQQNIPISYLMMVEAMVGLKAMMKVCDWALKLVVKKIDKWVDLWVVQ